MSPILLLTLSIAVVGANSLALSPLASEVASSFGLAPEDVLRAAAVYGIATAFSALTLAPRADRIGLRRALCLALGAATMGLVLSALAPGLFVLAAGQALAGLGAGVALPATYALASELAPPGRESETLGRVLTGWTLSLVAGVSLAAVVADWVHWRGVFGGMAVITLALVLIIWPTAKGSPRATQASSPLTAISTPGIVPALMTAAAFMSAFYGLYGYLGPHMTQTLGAATTTAGMAALVYGVGFGAIAPIDRWIDRVGAIRVAPVVFAVLVFVYLGLAALASTVWGLLFGCLIWGAVNHLGLNLIVGRLTALDPNQRGAIMGLYSATTYLAMFAGISLLRPVFEAGGFALTAIVASACILPAFGLAARRRRVSA